MCEFRNLCLFQCKFLFILHNVSVIPSIACLYILRHLTTADERFSLYKHHKRLISLQYTFSSTLQLNNINCNFEIEFPVNLPAVRRNFYINTLQHELLLFFKWIELNQLLLIVSHKVFYNESQLAW